MAHGTMPDTVRGTVLDRTAPQPRVAAGPRLEVLDGLRFLAAMAVLAYHFTTMDRIWQRPAVDVVPAQTFAYGWLGVYLFFLISGFVICMSSWDRGVGSFLLSRAVRLYPAYWLSVLVVAAGLAVFPGLPWRPTTLDVLVNLTMFQDAVGVPQLADVYWSLWAELRFYLLFSLLVWWGLSYRRVVACCALWLGAAAVAQAFLPVGGAVHGAVQLVLMTDYAPLFTAGIGCYLMFRFGPTVASWAIVAVSFVLALPAVIHRNQLESKAGEIIPNGPVIVLLAVWFLLIVAVGLGWLSWVRGRWLVVGGALTYPLYLLHLDLGGALLYLFQWHVPPPLLVPVVAGLMILIAWLVHRYVERPLAPQLKHALRWMGTRARGQVTR
ncbi:MAG TPA: acyltransferase [Actinophytocola sp.]|uniref:acyltransferase family protein n=1 Tax=Actinophytocola sp. TaxID=1872138 RepID=UPI002DBF62EA|nr:acyltransferase [Actinophytocola sp.]HEU5469260.1 acyltransferase [Actinophytocola sp.]